MYIYKVTFIIIVTITCFYHVCATLSNHHEDILVEEGQNIILHCKSNDKQHNFMFWHLAQTDTVIGPRNEFNNNKYKYEILSGNLTIRGITTNELGTYICISDGLNKRDILTHSVNLITKNNYNNGGEKLALRVPENNYENGNLWKASAILGSVFIFLLIILVALHFHYKRTEKPNYFENVEDEEDSTEELFTREPSTSGLQKNKVVEDNVEESDNFEKVYTTINMHKP